MVVIGFWCVGSMKRSLTLPIEPVIKEPVSLLSPWVLMEQAMLELQENGFETHVDEVINEIKRRQLSDKIELAYADSKHHLNDDKHDYPKHVRNLYKQFVRAVDDIKDDMAAGCKAVCVREKAQKTG
jgi:hypothetical protein